MLEGEKGMALLTDGVCAGKYVCIRLTFLNILLICGRDKTMAYRYVRDSGTGEVPGQHNNLIAIFC